MDNRNVTKRNGANSPSLKSLRTQTIRDLYNFPTNSAAGQTIGIVSVRGGYQSDDISAVFGGNPPTITEVSVDGITNSHNADFETTHDICIAGLAAPGAAIVVYFHNGSGQGWIDMLNKITHSSGSDPICSVVSSSFFYSDGGDDGTLFNEGQTSKQSIDKISSAFLDATVKGHVNIFVASGDTGSSSKVVEDLVAWGFAVDGKAHVQYLGSDPSILSVGGTTIANVNGATFDEYVWNNPNPFLCETDNWGTTGGGISDHFDLPSYQNL